MNAVQYAQSNQIVDLMRQPTEQRDTTWLHKAVQQAILLELATLPPYLCGMWSIDDTSGKANQIRMALRRIVFDEMSHLGLACNLLTTIGGTPRLTGDTLVPAYPGPLPGGVRPDLTVFLSGLTPESVEMYAKIEKPDHPITLAAPAAYTSIGAFYTAILEAFRANPKLITGKRQVERNMAHHGSGNSLERLETLDDVESAITVIKEQGEGTSTSPENPYPGEQGELAHYYAFLKVLETLQSPNPPQIKTLPMGVVPHGGWSRRGPGVPASALDTFNRTYSDMLGLLEQAWQQEAPGPAADLLQDAVDKMGALRTPARNLMKIALPDGSGKNYGPEFRYVAP
ncbi:hypothetical protein BN159_0086 [Streptomyces davaonensis JCM 4913]|uniref:Iminophenyl-pyruvate dimer synthase domain-containing protein n=1 Tax=Streptomyces davaonensis (strain DSM 101723 / JCM 4913 / KCC S-0913 / 768) TaxID=1214101 RepID=K4QUM7_STRDJ|nr:ferritin-like protein [Streptomyces davaonensis]CCK24465.1 hypothetical protein BN159_0086 [Streptomyces davaonensis JCM 4913]